MAEIAVLGMPVSLAGRSLLTTNSTHVAFCSQAGTQGDPDPHRAQCCGKELDSLGEAGGSCAIYATTSEFHLGIRVRTSGGTCEAIGRRAHDRSIDAYWTSLFSPVFLSLENVEREIVHGAASLPIHVNMAAAATEAA